MLSVLLVSTVLVLGLPCQTRAQPRWRWCLMMLKVCDWGWGWLWSIWLLLLFILSGLRPFGHLLSAIRSRMTLKGNTIRGSFTLVLGPLLDTRQGNVNWNNMTTRWHQLWRPRLHRGSKCGDHYGRRLLCRRCADIFNENMTLMSGRRLPRKLSGWILQQVSSWGNPSQVSSQGFRDCIKTEPKKVYFVAKNRPTLVKVSKFSGRDQQMTGAPNATSPVM